MPRTKKDPTDEVVTAPAAEQKAEQKKASHTRKCSYDPTKHLVQTMGAHGPEMYLPGKARVEWFNTWCEEKGVFGVIDDSEYKFYPEVPVPGCPVFFTATCTIYMDDKVAAKSQAGAPINFVSMPDYYNGMKTLATVAKKRALENCGFCGWGSNADEESEYERLLNPGMAVQNDQTVPPAAPLQQAEPLPAPQVDFTPPASHAVPKPVVEPPAPVMQAPEQIPVQPVVSAPVMEAPPVMAAPVVEPPQMPVSEAPAEEAPKPKRRTNAESKPVDAPQEGNPFRTVEEAMAYIIPSGEFQGKTIMQMKAESPMLFSMCAEGKMRAAAWKPAVYAAKMIVDAEK